MILVDCPHCGQRNSSEFRYGGEYNPRPVDPMAQTDAEWADYVYMQNNKLGIQKEWWYHRLGCQSWFVAERHTGTNDVQKTWLWEPATGNQQNE